MAEELASKGRLASPYVGLVMQPVTIPAALQNMSGVNAAAGLLVMHVEASGPAEAGGVLLGDILVSLDGQGFDALEDLQEILRRRGINEVVKGTVIRGGQKLELTLKIGERPLG